MQHTSKLAPGGMHAYLQLMALQTESSVNSRSLRLIISNRYKWEKGLRNKGTSVSLALLKRFVCETEKAVFTKQELVQFPGPFSHLAVRD